MANKPLFSHTYLILFTVSTHECDHLKSLPCYLLTIGTLSALSLAGEGDKEQCPTTETLIFLCLSQWDDK